MRKPYDVAVMVLFARNGSDHTNYVYCGLWAMLWVWVTQNLLERWLQLVMKGIQRSLACKFWVAFRVAASPNSVEKKEKTN